MFSHPQFLRRVLIIDALSSAGMGAALVLGAGAVDGLLGMPAEFLRAVGASLLPFAALVAYVATRSMPTRAAVWAIIAANLIWVADSLLLVVTGWFAPTALGIAFIIAQAVFVGVIAELEYFGLRRSLPAAA
jgi:hypothetical protein